MASISSARFLRRVLWADAVSCLACGLLQVTLAATLSSRLGLPAILLVDVGLFLLLYGAAVLFLATRIRIVNSIVWLLIAGNIAWAVACIALLLDSAAALTVFGKAYLVLQASAVAILARLQYAGVRNQNSSASVPAATERN